jgi:hypothetical protein
MTFDPGPDSADHELGELVLFVGVKTKLFKHRTMAE